MLALGYWSARIPEFVWCELDYCTNWDTLARPSTTAARFEWLWKWR